MWFIPGSRRQVLVLGFTAAAIGCTSPSPLEPPITTSSVPVHTETYPSRGPSGPRDSFRQWSVRGS